MTGSGVQTAVGVFIVACKTAGIWTKMKRVNVYAGDALAALEAPLLNTWGATTDTLTNFDSGDYTEATGLAGNGTDEYINTGVNLSSASGASINDVHGSVYMRTYTAESFAYGMGSRGSGGTNLFGVRPRNDDTSYFYCTGASEDGAASDSDGLGLYTGSRISASSKKLYRRTTALSDEDPTSTTLPNANVFVHCFSADGTPSSLTTRKISFYSIGLGLTSSGVSSLYSAVQTLQTTLGRQV